MPTITVTHTIDRPAPAVWAVLADYARDPEWRHGVETMAPSSSGPVEVGTTTAEVLRFGGRTYRSGGEVTSVEPGTAFTWRTTPGADADADGRRRVRAIDARSTSVTLEVTVRTHGVERALQPVLVRLLRRGMRSDLERLAALVERDTAEAPAP